MTPMSASSDERSHKCECGHGGEPDYEALGEEIERHPIGRPMSDCPLCKAKEREITALTAKLQEKEAELAVAGDMMKTQREFHQEQKTKLEAELEAARITIRSMRDVLLTVAKADPNWISAIEDKLKSIEAKEPR